MCFSDHTLGRCFAGMKSKPQAILCMINPGNICFPGILAKDGGKYAGCLGSGRTHMMFNHFDHSEVVKK